jgi:hypothetical protein
MNRQKKKSGFKRYGSADFNLYNSPYLALALHALCGAGGEEGQDEGEGRDEHLGQGVDDADLLEDRLRVVERRQESRAVERYKLAHLKKQRLETGFSLYRLPLRARESQFSAVERLTIGAKDICNTFVTVHQE